MIESEALRGPSQVVQAEGTQRHSFSRSGRKSGAAYGSSLEDFTVRRASRNTGMERLTAFTRGWGNLGSALYRTGVSIASQPCWACILVRCLFRSIVPEWLVCRGTGVRLG